MSQHLSAQTSGAARQALGALEDALALALRALALLERLLQTQKSSRVLQQPAASLTPRRQPAGIHRLDLGAGELVPHDLLGQLAAGLPVQARQRHQGFHRGLGGDLTAADRLLDRDRKLAHQPQAPRDPADASEKPPRQLLLAPAEAVSKLRQ